MRGLVVSFFIGAVLLYAMVTVFPGWLVIAIGVCVAIGAFLFGVCMAGAASAGEARERAQEKAQEWTAWDDIYEGRGRR
jgi:hypothetical protein